MARRLPLHPALATVAAGAALILTACGSAASPEGAVSDGAAPSDGGRASVVAAFYPLEYVANAVGGEAVSVTSLTPPGVEPHDLELTAAQVADIASADLVLYVRGFQPAVDEAVDQQAADRAIDVSAGLPLLGEDPHVWLDPENMIAIGDAVAARLVDVDPEASATFTANAARLAGTMTALDGEFTTGLASCASRDIVVSHEAFAYLAAAYDLTQIGISGLSPEAEPSPARLADVAALVQDKGISTIYYETLVDPKVAQTVADETGATTMVLDPLEGLAADSTGDYASVMRENLATLITGQLCS